MSVEVWAQELGATVVACDEVQVLLAGDLDEWRRKDLGWLSDELCERADRIRGVLERRYGVEVA